MFYQSTSFTDMQIPYLLKTMANNPANKVAPKKKKIDKSKWPALFLPKDKKN